MFFNKNFSIAKSKKILFHSYKWYQKKEKHLSDTEKKTLQSSMKDLEKLILEKNRSTATQKAKELENLSKTYLKKTFFEKTFESLITLAIAIFIAVLVRQMWFENYTIPTGSMRPTLKEKDFLIVSKTTFSVNKPTSVGSFYFNPDLVYRGDIIVFSTANMDVKDNDYMYFYIIPGKKQFVKRLIGKPGDTLYFYGGQIFGIDKNGNEIEEYRKNIWFTDIEHIPFIRFEGNQIFSNSSSYGFPPSTTIMQMNTPIARIQTKIGTLLTEKKAPFSDNFSPSDYFDVWGFKNYATARIITKKQAINFNLIPKENTYTEDYFLEFTHHPSIKKIQIEKDYLGRFIPTMTTYTSIIPLDQSHLNTVLKNLYTCRFKVKNGSLFRIGYNIKNENYPFTPKLKNIPNGTYEFQDGIAYKINFTGLSKKLPPNHPIYSNDPDNIITLYNLGIEMNNLFSPKEKNQSLKPSRYAYFRNGDLYLMGKPVFKKDDPVLVSYIQKEMEKNYPFIDFNPPLLANGKIDKEVILKYGLKIPDGYYLMLGDNHAMSSDCRDFGFVPEKNIRGKPSFLYWPLQQRAGRLLQPRSSWFILPKLIIFSLVILCSFAYYFYHKRKYKLPIKFK